MRVGPPQEGASIQFAAHAFSRIAVNKQTDQILARHRQGKRVWSSILPSLKIRPDGMPVLRAIGPSPETRVCTKTNVTRLDGSASIVTQHVDELLSAESR
jgi:hypothetical protein